MEQNGRKNFSYFINLIMFFIVIFSLFIFPYIFLDSLSIKNIIKNINYYSPNQYTSSFVTSFIIIKIMLFSFSFSFSSIILSKLFRDHNSHILLFGIIMIFYIVLYIKNSYIIEKCNNINDVHYEINNCPNNIDHIFFYDYEEKNNLLLNNNNQQLLINKFLNLKNIGLYSNKCLKNLCYNEYDFFNINNELLITNNNYTYSECLPFYDTYKNIFFQSFKNKDIENKICEEFLNKINPYTITYLVLSIFIFLVEFFFSISKYNVNLYSNYDESYNGKDNIFIYLLCILIIFANIIMLISTYSQLFLLDDKNFIIDNYFNIKNYPLEDFLMKNIYNEVIFSKCLFVIILLPFLYFLFFKEIKSNYKIIKYITILYCLYTLGLSQIIFQLYEYNDNKNFNFNNGISLFKSIKIIDNKIDYINNNILNNNISKINDISSVIYEIDDDNNNNNNPVYFGWGFSYDEIKNTTDILIRWSLFVFNKENNNDINYLKLIDIFNEIKNYEFPKLDNYGKLKSSSYFDTAFLFFFIFFYLSNMILFIFALFFYFGSGCFN